MPSCAQCVCVCVCVFCSKLTIASCFHIIVFVFFVLMRTSFASTQFRFCASFRWIQPPLRASDLLLQVSSDPGRCLAGCFSHIFLTISFQWLHHR